MHCRRLRQQAGEAVVLSMAYPKPTEDFLVSDSPQGGKHPNGRFRLRVELFGGAALPTNAGRRGLHATEP